MLTYQIRKPSCVTFAFGLTFLCTMLQPILRFNYIYPVNRNYIHFKRFLQFLNPSRGFGELGGHVDGVGLIISKEIYMSGLC